MDKSNTIPVEVAESVADRLRAYMLRRIALIARLREHGVVG